MKTLSRLSAVSLLGAMLAGCDTTRAFIEPHSSIAREQANLYWTILWMAVAVFALVEALLLYNIIRFRAKKGDDSPPPQIYGHNTLETIWTAIPLLLVATLFFFAVQTVNAISAPPKAGGDVNVRVIGHQWWWEYQYPDFKFVTANDLHVPVGTNVHFTLIAKDVIHSFWIPQLSGKIDVVPGQVNSLWFRADEVGEYYGQCAEFCGLNHANMKIKVIVQTQEEFDAWVANQQLPPVEPQTEQQQDAYKIITTGLCKQCHTLGDSVAADEKGPNLNHLMSRSTFAGAMYPLDEAHLKQWLTNGQEMKPGNDMIIKLKKDEIDALMAYLTTLK